MRCLFLLAAVIMTAAAPAFAQSIPQAVISDSPAGLTPPPRSAQVLIPSGGFGMNALFYFAGGPGLHPSVVLLHGIPGNEQNLDLAQAIRRAGWNVLTLHYRGAWGSPGTFSIVHALQDADAAVAFVRNSAVGKQFGIGSGRIVLAGHSMGGLAAAFHARHDKGLSGVILLDAWNAGATGDEFARVEPGKLAAVAAQGFNDFGNALSGATPASVADEVIAHRAEWNFQTWAGELTGQPLLVIGALQANGAENHRLAQAVAASGGKVTDMTLPSDHGFQDHRIALEAAAVTWLQALPAR